MFCYYIWCLLCTNLRWNYFLVSTGYSTQEHAVNKKIIRWNANLQEPVGDNWESCYASSSLLLPLAFALAQMFCAPGPHSMQALLSNYATPLSSNCIKTGSGFNYFLFWCLCLCVRIKLQGRYNLWIQFKDLLLILANPRCHKSQHITTSSCDYYSFPFSGWFVFVCLITLAGRGNKGRLAGLGSHSTVKQVSVESVRCLAS